MSAFEIANDVQLATMLVPGSSPDVYFAADASQPISASRAGSVMVSGVVQFAKETEVAGQSQLAFQLRLELQGSNDRCVWHRLGSPADGLIASYIDSTSGKLRSAAPNRFRGGTFGVDGFAWVRARWSLYPVDPSQDPPPPLIDDLSVDLTSHLGFTRRAI